MSPCLSYENEFDLHENEPVHGTDFLMNGLARRLNLTQRQRATKQWPIGLISLRSLIENVSSACSAGECASGLLFSEYSPSEGIEILTTC